MSRVGVITGLAREARILEGAARAAWRGEPPIVVATGANAGRARDAARTLLSRGAGALASFGFAGGLDPTLEAGDLVLADRVIDPMGENTATDAAWRERLKEALATVGPVHVGAVAGSDEPVTGVAAKAALFAATEALAVDMESHGVARAAREHGVPFIVLRAIVDPARRAVPRAALAGIGEDGASRPLPLLLALLKEPRQLPGLVALARDARGAARALGRAAAGGAPLFAGP